MANQGVLLGWNELHGSLQNLTRRIDTLASAISGQKSSSASNLFAGIRATPTSALAQTAMQAPGRTTPHPAANFSANPLSRAGWQNAASSMPYQSGMASSTFGNFAMPTRVPNGGARTPMQATATPSTLLQMAGQKGSGPVAAGGGSMLPPTGGASLLSAGNGGHQSGALKRLAPIAAAGAVGFAGRSLRALSNYGDEKMQGMVALELASSSAALSQSDIAGVGRSQFLAQAMGPSATQPSNTIAIDQADAIDTVLARIRTSGSLALSSARDTSADRAWRSMGMVVGNASFSSSDAALAAGQVQSPQFQHRAAMLGLGSTFDPKSHAYIGNAELARRMLTTSTGSANPTQERLAAGLQEGGKLRYMLQQTGWDSKTTEQFTGYMSQLVDLQQRGLDYRKVDSLLAQASDKSSPGYGAARKELQNHYWTETQLQIEKDTKALDRSADAQVFEEYIGNLKKSSKAVEDWTTFLKKFLDLPPVKAFLGIGGAIAKIKDNPGSLLTIPGFGGTTSGPGWMTGLDPTRGLGEMGGNDSHIPQAGPPTPPAGKGSGQGRPKTTGANSRNQPTAGGGVGAAIAFAQAQLGEPYLWGGTGPNAWDCSGLMQAAYRAAGKKISRTTWTQVRDGTPVSRDPKAWQPGDLVFPSPGHVVMWLGGGRYIHAPRKGDVVKISSGTPRAFAVNRIMGGGGSWVNATGTDPKAADGNKPKTDNGKSGPGTAQAEPATDWASNVNTLGQGSLAGPSGTLGMSELEVLSAIFGGPPLAPGENPAASPQAQEQSSNAGSAISAAQKITDTLGDIAAKTGGKNGKTAAAPKGGSPEANKQLGQAMASGRGWSGAQWDSLLKLWTKESGWNNRAVNKSSGAAGIPQLNPSAHPGIVTEEWMANPQAQIQWGLNYIAGRYKSPSKAWEHSQRIGWYRSGSWDVREDELAVVHQGEMVLPAPAARKVRDVLTDNAPASGNAVHFTFGPASIQLHMGAGASPATARTTARELFAEFERIVRDSEIAKGR